MSNNIPHDYEARFQMAKLVKLEEAGRGLKLDNDRKTLELQKTQSNLCYIKVAGDTFNSALSSIAAIIRTAGERVAREIHATPEQSDVLNAFFDDLLSQLSQISIDIPTTVDVDAQLDHAGKAAREQARGC